MTCPIKQPALCCPHKTETPFGDLCCLDNTRCMEYILGCDVWENPELVAEDEL